MQLLNKCGRLHVFVSTAKRFCYISLGLQYVLPLLSGLDVTGYSAFPVSITTLCTKEKGVTHL